MTTISTPDTGVARREPLPPGFGSIWMAVAIDLVGFGIIIPILPLYAHDLGASAATVGLLVASFSIAQLVAAPVLGRLSDRFGRKPVLIATMVGTSIGSLLTGLAPGLALLFLGRVVDGASGASVAVARAAVSDIAPPSQHARLLGLLGAAFGVGFVVGPALGGLASVFGPRVPFLVAAVISGLNALVAVRRLPATRAVDDDSGSTDHGWRGTIAASPVLGTVLAVSFLGVFAFGAFEATFALVAASRLDLGLGATSAVFAATGLVVAASSGGLVHATVRRRGEAGALQIGLILVAIGLAGLAQANDWLLLIPALASLAIGQGLTTPTITTIVSRLAPPGRRGGVLGVQQSAGSLARIAGPATGGIAFQLGGGSLAMGVAAITTVGAVGLLRRVDVFGVMPSTAPARATHEHEHEHER